MTVGPRWRDFPVTVTVLALVVTIGIATARASVTDHDRLMDAVGMDLPALRHFRLWAIPAATFVQSSPGVEWHMLALIGFPLLALEYGAGSWRALITFLLSDWLTAPVTVLTLWLLSDLGNNQAHRLLYDPDTGSSAAAHGALAAAIMLLPPKWAIGGMAVLVAISLYALTFERLDASIAHLLGIVVGAALGILWSLQQDRGRPAQLE